jgi:hypothetical protein
MNTYVNLIWKRTNISPSSVDKETNEKQLGPQESVFKLPDSTFRAKRGTNTQKQAAPLKIKTNASQGIILIPAKNSQLSL